VKEPQKLGWLPKEMLTNTANLLLNTLSASSTFATFLGESDTFDIAMLEKAHSILATKCSFSPLGLEQLQSLIAKLKPTANGAAAGSVPVAQQARSAADAASGGLEPQALLASVTSKYVAELAPSAFDECVMTDAKGEYMHYYRQNIAEAPQGGAAKVKIKRLVQELSRLSEEGSLPVSGESCVLVKRDETRMDVLKVIISGPADVADASNETPYAFGLFEFAVFIPPDYPNVPPLVNLQTTGGGMVRFNPNLYSDGKVCLSLLGTWHGEGWTAPSAGNPGSTILQVLVSIQSIIMVAKPYFNEPGYAEEMGTPAGEARSNEYNESTRLHTMRHAMRDMLRRPPAGFEDQVRAHFRIVRPLLLRTLALWLEEASTPSARVAMEKAYLELVPLLEALGATSGEAAASGAGTSADAGSTGGMDADADDTAASAMDIS